jgi:protein translocase SecG subunit
MQAVLLVIQLLVSVALIGVVLLQRSEGGALGMGGGGSGLGGLFSPRGAADTLTRTTAILAILFFFSSLRNSPHDPALHKFLQFRRRTDNRSRSVASLRAFVHMRNF